MSSGTFLSPASIAISNGLISTTRRPAALAARGPRRRVRRPARARAFDGSRGPRPGRGSGEADGDKAARGGELAAVAYYWKRQSRPASKRRRGPGRRRRARRGRGARESPRELRDNVTQHIN